MRTQNVKKRNKLTINDRAALIKTQLYLRNVDQRDIAKELNVSDAAISLFISGNRTSKRFNSWVLDNLGIEVQEKTA